MEQHEEKFVEKFIFLRPRTNSSSIKKWNIFNDFNTQKYLFFSISIYNQFCLSISRAQQKHSLNKDKLNYNPCIYTKGRLIFIYFFVPFTKTLKRKRY